jgi:hypothetical protein
VSRLCGERIMEVGGGYPPSSTARLLSFSLLKT